MMMLSVVLKNTNISLDVTRSVTLFIIHENFNNTNKQSKPLGKIATNGDRISLWDDSQVVSNDVEC